MISINVHHLFNCRDVFFPIPSHYFLFIVTTNISMLGLTISRHVKKNKSNNLSDENFLPKNFKHTKFKNQDLKNEM